MSTSGILCGQEDDRRWVRCVRNSKRGVERQKKVEELNRRRATVRLRESGRPGRVRRPAPSSDRSLLLSPGAHAFREGAEREQSVPERRAAAERADEQSDCRVEEYEEARQRTLSVRLCDAERVGGQSVHLPQFASPRRGRGLLMRLLALLGLCWLCWMQVCVCLCVGRLCRSDARDERVERLQREGDARAQSEHSEQPVLEGLRHSVRHWLCSCICIYWLCLGLGVWQQVDAQLCESRAQLLERETHSLFSCSGIEKSEREGARRREGSGYLYKMKNKYVIEVLLK